MRSLEEYLNSFVRDYSLVNLSDEFQQLYMMWKQLHTQHQQAQNKIATCLADHILWYFRVEFQHTISSSCAIKIQGPHHVA